MAASMAVDLVEEPRSGMLVPSELQERDDALPKELLGIGLRVKRVMGVEVQVYVAAVYGAAGLLLGAEEGAILTDMLFTSPAEKAVCLTFLRSLPAHKVTDSFKDTLHQEFGVPLENVSAFTRTLPPSFVRGTEVRLRLRPLLGEVAVSGEWLEEGALLQSPDLCRGLQEMIYGPRLVVTGLEESLQSQREALQPSSRYHGGLGHEASSFSSDDQRSSGAETPDRCPDSPERGSLTSPGGLPPIRSESELADALAAVPPLPGREEEPSETASAAANPQEDMLPRRRRSWKTRSGREGGGDGYRFGDFTRTVVNKTRKRMGSTGGGARPSLTSSLVESWLGALVVEGEEAPWVQLDSVPKLDAAELAGQQLNAALYKHHTSPVRGSLVPQWSLRYFELRAGTLRYRKRKDGPERGSFSLDGAWVVLEPPKACRMGDCLVFRVASDAGLLCRLSCSDKDVATSFALAVAAACAHFHALHCSDDQHPAASEAKADSEDKAAAEALSTPNGSAAHEKAEADGAGASRALAPLELPKGEKALDARLPCSPISLSGHDPRWAERDAKALDARLPCSPISLSGYDPRWATPVGTLPTTLPAASSASSARTLAAVAAFLAGAFGLARWARGRRSSPAFLMAFLLLLPALAARRRSAAGGPLRLPLGPAQ